MSSLSMRVINGTEKVIRISNLAGAQGATGDGTEDTTARAAAAAAQSTADANETEIQNARDGEASLLAKQQAQDAAISAAQADATTALGGALVNNFIKNALCEIAPNSQDMNFENAFTQVRDIENQPYGTPYYDIDRSVNSLAGVTQNLADARLAVGDSISIRVGVSAGTIANRNLILVWRESDNTQISTVASSKDDFTGLGDIKELTFENITIPANAANFYIYGGGIASGSVWRLHYWWGEKAATVKETPPYWNSGTLAYAEIAAAIGSSSSLAAKLSELGAGSQDVTYTSYVIASSGGDYTTCTAAIAAIADATVTNQYLLFVEPGTYTENGSGGRGLVPKDYVHIIGAGRGRTFLKAPEETAGNETLGSTIRNGATFIIANCSLIAYKTKYCIHWDDSASQYKDYHAIALGLDMRHYGGADGFGYDVGIGLYGWQKMEFIDCRMFGKGALVHGANTARYALAKSNLGWLISFKNCSMYFMTLSSSLEYQINTIRLQNNLIDHLSFGVTSAGYTANPSDPLFNKGYFNRDVIFEDLGNRIGYISISSATPTPDLYPEGLELTSVNYTAKNTSGASILQGYAVKLLPPEGGEAGTGTVPDAYPSDDMVFNEVALWDGSGFFGGFAEQTIADNEIKTIANKGRPRARVNSAGGAVARGDRLELRSDGTLQKLASGVAVAISLTDVSSGVSFAPVKLISEV